MNPQYLRFQKGIKSIFFDLETCNLNLGMGSNNLPWQLGFIVLHDDNVVCKRDILVWWDDLQISAKAAEVTRFDFEKYKKNAIDPRQALSEFEKYALDPEYQVCGHNILNFDLFVLNNWRWHLGLRPVDGLFERCIDTRAIAQAIKMENYRKEGEPLIEWQTRALFVRAKGIKTALGGLGKEFGIEHDYERLHDAICDLELNIKVWQYLKAKYPI